MAGLLGDVLPWVYSQGDRAKRFLGGLLSDPAGMLAREVNHANDRAGGLLAQTRAATDEGMSYGPATQRLASTLADSYNPIGMNIWHGSNKFDGLTPFDLKRVGDNTGAFTEGWGAYFSADKKNAKAFGNKLHSVDLPDDVIASRFIDLSKPISEQNQAVKRFADAMKAADPQELASNAWRLMRYKNTLDAPPKGIQRAVSGATTNEVAGGRASFDIDKFKAIANDLGVPDWQLNRYVNLIQQSPARGYDLYKGLAEIEKSQKSASQTLDRNGISGAQFKANLDLHAKNPNATNFVIWDQDLLNEMYGGLR